MISHDTNTDYLLTQAHAVNATLDCTHDRASACNKSELHAATIMVCTDLAGALAYRDSHLAATI